MHNKKAASYEKRSAETKDKILRSAEALFKENSFENTSVDSIMKKAGLIKRRLLCSF